jgi:hypothetical protein
VSIDNSEGKFEFKKLNKQRHSIKRKRLKERENQKNGTYS